jgi:hypothetical protein
MTYRIVHELSRRIRVRCGRYAFNPERAAALEGFLRSQEGVESVRVSCTTGSVLLTFDPARKGALLDRLGGVDLAALPPAVGAEAHEADLEFRNSLIFVIGRHLVTRYLLPPPLGALYTYYRTGRLVKKGLGALLRGRLNVDVLDAAAVSVSLAQGHGDTASSIMFMLSLGEILEEYTHKKS